MVDRYTCVGCGFCCIEAKCAVSERLYPSVEICPQLIWDKKDNRYYCDLMRIPGIIGESYRAELYAGAGCCSNLNSWRHDVKERNPYYKKRRLKSPIDKLFQLFLNQLGKEWISGDIIHFVFSGWEHEMEKDGMDKKEIKTIVETAKQYYLNNKPSYINSFMG